MKFEVKGGKALSRGTQNTIDRREGSLRIAHGQHKEKDRTLKMQLIEKK